MSFQHNIKSFLRTYLLEAVSILTASTIMGIATQMGPTWPKFQFIPYITAASIVAIVSYVASLSGLWVYLTTNNSSISEYLDDPEYFVSVLKEPMVWGDRSIAFTLVYFASNHWPANRDLTFLFQVISLSAIISTIVAIARHFYVIKIYLMEAVNITMERDRVSDRILEDFFKRLQDTEAIPGDKNEEIK